ncbi:DNA (cytosine-5)-methyltransferase CMT2 [Vitis vinifera]|uniref:DNA (cytosine-5-)-methyltransferase n=1 Tax=Vitis vinifera TaxID=29760 RepID=A0A438IXB8_VITVI|nr:DNA (cytosine-5)-methyltransferase CMT2 [Vitis vinifera]
MDGCKPDKAELALLDLYSGCGGMSTGLCLGAKLSCVNLVTKWALDFDKSACESLKLNHPETQVRNETAEDFLDLLKEWEMLCEQYALNLVERKSQSRSNVLRTSKSNINSPHDIKVATDELEILKLVDICYGDPSETGKRGLKFKPSLDQLKLFNNAFEWKFHHILEPLVLLLCMTCFGVHSAVELIKFGPRNSYGIFLQALSNGWIGDRQTSSKLPLSLFPAFSLLSLMSQVDFSICLPFLSKKCVCPWFETTQPDEGALPSAKGIVLGTALRLQIALFKASAETVLSQTLAISCSRGGAAISILVRWKGYGPSEDTWEPIEGLSNCQEGIYDFVRNGLKSKILPRPGDVDVICGGPPCQGISGYNRFRNVDSPLSDERNHQIVIFMDIVKFLKPKYVLMENVVDLLKLDKASLGRYAISRLVHMKYQARLGMIAAGCYGLPQFRLRVFLWGAHPGESLPQFPLPTHDVVAKYWPPSEFECNIVAYDEGQPRELEKAVVLRDAISDLPAVTNYETRDEMLYGKPPETEFQKYIRSTKDGNVLSF